MTAKVAYVLAYRCDDYNNTLYQPKSRYIDSCLLWHTTLRLPYPYNHIRPTSYTLYMVTFASIRGSKFFPLYNVSGMPTQYRRYTRCQRILSVRYRILYTLGIFYHNNMNTIEKYRNICITVFCCYRYAFTYNNIFISSVFLFGIHKANV